MTSTIISELGKIYIIVDNSILINKTNAEMKKSDQLIEQLNLKLEIYFEYFKKNNFRKFEKDEISSELINEVVKKELAPLRPLFISSKNIKEKVFASLR